MPNRLVIESGSTKADWVLLNKKKVVFETSSIGLNPKVISLEKFQNIAQSVLISMHDLEVNELYFYGSGIIGFEDKIKRIFENLLPIDKVKIQSDLMAACYASSFENKLICILGTGSYVGYFKKNKLIETRLGHGYIIGDLCSGSEFGKILVRDYLNGEAPFVIGDEIHYSTAEIKNEIYQEEFPNRFLASLFPILSRHKTTDYVKEIIHNQISLLDQKGIQSLKSTCQNICFIGGVACQLSQELDNYFGPHFKLEFIERPIEKLISYHQTKLLD
ncbi:MAG: hypothetical protein R2799_01730 [Crocinitomicaceae bacterium]